MNKEEYADKLLCNVLIKACELAGKSLHRFLAVAYRCGPDYAFVLCKTCGRKSPINDDRASFRTTHDEHCYVAAAIVAEQAVYDALREAESTGSNDVSPVGGKNE